MMTLNVRHVTVWWCTQARVMATIGVTRGLGDHDLKVYNSNIYIKPFLSCVPEVSVPSQRCLRIRLRVVALTTFESLERN